MLDLADGFDAVVRRWRASGWHHPASATGGTGDHRLGRRVLEQDICQARQRHEKTGCDDDHHAGEFPGGRLAAAGGRTVVCGTYSGVSGQ